MGSEEVKRTCCLIVDNMCKVVEDPAAVVPVMPRLEPLVKAACEKIADPEARAVAERALATMRKAAEGSELKTVSAETAAEMLKAICGDKMTSDAELFLPYVASLAASATNMRSYKPEAWKKSVALCEPFGDVIDDVRSKLELASKPAEEKKAYFELSNEVMKFVFPAPGPMEGVKSRSKTILRMDKVNFQYPTKDKPTIMDVSLTVSQVSRVAVIGANGAGKSTAIKVLVGEAKPT